MQLFIDFDYTLFDTHAMRAALRTAFAEYGITAEQYNDAEKVVTASGMYTIEAHVAGLGDFVDSHDLLPVAQRVLQDTSAFLYPDALEFLQNHAQHNITILSYGNEEWQRAKIQASGIISDGVVLQPTSKPKSEYIQEWLTNNAERAVLVNDRGSEIDAIHASTPSVHAVWIRRPGTPYTDELCEHANEEYTDLNFTIDL